MTSYLRKYVSALASAKDYVAQWSSEHIYADEELIVPFPTLARFDPHEGVWSVNIKAWVYVPFQNKSLSSYLPSLPRFLWWKKSDEIKEKETTEKLDTSKNGDLKKQTIFNEGDADSVTGKSEENKIGKDEKNAAAVVSEENRQARKDKQSGDEETDSDDDGAENALKEEIGEPSNNPGRLGLFFVGNSVKVTTKSIINGVEHLLQPSDESGFIEHQIEISDEHIKSLCKETHSDCKDKKFEYQIQLSERKKNENVPNEYKTFKCAVYVLAPHGVSVISDIDDTVKFSNVLSKRLLLKHTFYSYFEPIEGMNEIYQKWHEQKCQFHYVSASPWQLYPALRSFLEDTGFPLGTMNLRRFSWNLEFFHPADTYKLETISEIIDAYPSRKYICVGDSGELDPEIYAKVFAKYPDAIAHIFIRDVCQTEPCSVKCEERYKEAFESVPSNRWTVFKDPKEIEADINKLVSVNNT